MHPVIDPGEARVLIGLDYLAAALADLAGSVRLVISPGGVQLVLSLLGALRVDNVAEWFGRNGHTGHMYHLR